MHVRLPLKSCGGGTRDTAEHSAFQRGSPHQSSLNASSADFVKL